MQADDRRPGSMLVPVVTILMAALFCGPAHAQPQDVVGIYFDQYGAAHSTTTTSPYEPVTAYLVITNPSEPSGVSGWECIVDVLAGADVAGIWTFEGTGINGDSPPRFEVALAAPLPWQPSLRLATHTVFVPSPNIEVKYYIHAYDPPVLHDPPGMPWPVPAYAAGDDPSRWLPLEVSSGCEMEPVAIINPGAQSDSLNIAFDPPLLDFGYVTVGDVEVLLLEIINPSAAVIAGTASITGSGFSMQVDGGTVGASAPFRLVPPRDRVPIFVWFETAVAGIHSGEVVLRLCDGDTPLAVVPCRAHAGIPVCNIHPEVIGFRHVDLGTFADTTFTIKNVGGGMLRGRFPNLHANPFEFPDYPVGGAFELEPGRALQARARFAPFGLGVISYREGFDTDCELLLSGTGSGVDCDVAPTELDFGDVEIGFPEDLSFTITPIGTDTLRGEIASGCGHFSVLGGGGPFAIVEPTQWTVRFDPPAHGLSNCVIPIEGVCDDLRCSGVAWNADPACSLSTELLDFGPVQVGQIISRSFRIFNTGNVPLMLDVLEDCDLFHLSVGAGIVELPEGGDHRVVVDYFPDHVGSDTCIVSLGEPLCGDMTCVGVGIEIGGDDDVIGLYFDRGGVVNSRQTSGPMELVTAYLLILNPSSEWGAWGWECCAELVGGFESPFWLLAGSAINLDTPPCFAVGLSGQPLMAEPAMLLATLRFFQVDPAEATWLYIHPGSNPSLPGVPLYADGLDPGLLIPLTQSSGSADLPVATVNAGEIVDAVPDLQGVTILHSGYPNPFNPVTNIPFELGRTGYARLEILDLTGRRIRTLVDDVLPAGQHVRRWSGRDDLGRRVASGTYSCRLTAGRVEFVGKLILLK